MALINDHQLAVTREKLDKLYKMLERLKEHEKDPFFYEIQAEGIQALIDQMEGEVADYLKSKAAPPQPVGTASPTT